MVTGHNISKKFLSKNFLNAAHKDELKIPQPEMGFIAYVWFAVRSVLLAKRTPS